MKKIFYCFNYLYFTLFVLSLSSYSNENVFKFSHGLTINNEKIEEVESQNTQALTTLGYGRNFFDLDFFPMVYYSYYSDENFSTGPILAQKILVQGFGAGLSYFKVDENSFIFAINYFPGQKTTFNNSEKNISNTMQIDFGYKMHFESLALGFHFVYQKIDLEELEDPKGNYTFTDLIPSFDVWYIF